MLCKQAVNACAISARNIEDTQQPIDQVVTYVTHKTSNFLFQTISKFYTKRKFHKHSSSVERIVVSLKLVPDESKGDIEYVQNMYGISLSLVVFEHRIY